MKKSLAIKLISALLIFIFLFSLTGCYNEDKEEDNFVLSEKAELKIKEAYLADSQNKNADDIVIRHYLGNYNGSLAVIIRVNPVITIKHGEMVAGIHFNYGFSMESIRVYRAGRIYNLSQAYKRGFLKKADVKKLSNRYYALYPQHRP